VTVQGAKLTIRNEFIYIALFGLSLLALIAVGVEGSLLPLALLRVVLGLAFVLVVPGYALQAALFARRDDLEGTERLALSFGLSIALLSLLALVLSLQPRGVRLWPIMAMESLVIIACAVIALVRRRRLPQAERFAIVVRLDAWDRWRAQDRGNQVLYGLLVGAVVVAVVSALLLVALPRAGDRFTEFCLLGPEGLAEGYPREAVLGRPLELDVGIANHEGADALYRVQVVSGRHTVGETSWTVVPSGAIDERLVTITLYEAGEDIPVEFLLYRDDEAEPYRRLQLWLDVAQAPADD
jgi:uncharacterized membrane protein